MDLEQHVCLLRHVECEWQTQTSHAFYALCRPQQPLLGVHLWPQCSFNIKFDWKRDIGWEISWRCWFEKGCMEVSAVIGDIQHYLGEK